MLGISSWPLLWLSPWVVLAQAPDLVVSVGHAGAASRATFVAEYLVTAARSDVAVIDLASGLTVAHLPQGSLVTSLEASPAGEIVAIGTCGRSVELWNVRSRNPAGRLTLTQECADSLSFDPSGNLLAVEAYGCCRSGPGLQVWDVRTGRVVRELAKSSRIRHVAFSGDGRWIAAVDENGRAILFEWPSGREYRRFDGLDMSGHSSSTALASRDGRHFVWVGRKLRAWNVESSREVPVASARHGRPSAARFLDDGRLAYTEDDGLITLRLPDGPREETPLPSSDVDVSGHVALSFSQPWLAIRRDGAQVAASRPSRFVVWDAGSDGLRELISPSLVAPSSLQWADSGLVAWADLDAGVRGWDDRAGRPASLGSAVESGTSLAMRSDGARIAIAGHSSMYVLDVTRRLVMASHDIPPMLRTGVAFSRDGSRIAFEATDGLTVFDEGLRPRRRVATVEPYTSVEHVSFSGDGRWIAAGLGGPAPALRVWPATGAGGPVTLDTDRLTYGPQPPAFSADSTRLASFVRGNSVVVWSASSWRVERTWRLPGPGQALTFAPGGTRLAVASQGEAAIWDAGTGVKMVAFSRQGSLQFREIAWSPDGDRVATSGDDGVLRFWHAVEGRLLSSLYMLSDGNWLLVAPDGRLDGSEPALAQLVAWRSGDRVAVNPTRTRERRVPNLWRVLNLEHKTAR